MRTVILEEPGRLAFIDTAPPASPGPGEALVRVQRIGVCGTDLHAYRGKQPFFRFPRILGHELGVEVLAVGENSQGIQPGDRCAVEPYLHCGQCIACRQGKTNCCARLEVLGVHIDGGMREQIVVPTAKLHRSDSLNLEQLALVEPLSIGAHAVRRGSLVAGETVLVIGAGPIGLAVIQFAMLSGVRVLVMDSNQERLAFAREHFGVTETLTPSEQTVERLQELTDGDLPTAVFDAAGSSASMAAAFRYVAQGGRLVLVGLFQGDLSFNDPDAHRRELTLLCSRNATAEDFRMVRQGMEDGHVRVNAWVTQRVPLEEVPVALPQWLEPGMRFVKGIVEI